MQNFGVTNKEHYGMLWYFLEWSIVAKLRHSIPLRPLLNIYQALINPYLYYGICAWGSAPKTYLNKILLIKKRALRLIYFTDYKQHAVPFFLKSKVFPLSFISFDCLCPIFSQ